MRLALVDGLGARVVLPIWAGAGGALLVPSDRGDGLRGLGRPAEWTGGLLEGEFGRGCAGGRDEGGLGGKGGRGHGARLLARLGLELGILVCGAVGVVRRGGWLGRIGRLAASELLDEVFDGLALWIVEGGEGGGPGVVVGAGGGRGLLLYGGWVGRQGIEGGDELEHGLARGRGEDGGGLGWRGQLPGGLLDMGVCRVVLGRGVGVDGSGGGAVEGVSKEGIEVVPGGLVCGTHPAMSCSRRIFPWDSLVLEGDWSGRWEDEAGGVGICWRGGSRAGRAEAAG
jgi:hypothetical protein